MRMIRSYAIRNEKLTESWQKCDFLEQVNGKIQLKRNHRYYAQIIGQMAITGHHNTYFVAFTSQDILIDCVKFDESYWQKILPNLIVFFKTYIQKYLLGITQIFICPMCEKPCLNSNEFETDEENSKQCDRCSVWIHWGCSGITKETDVSKDFVCLLCQ